METVLRRARGAGVGRLAGMLLWFSCATEIEKLHPLQCGLLRLKRRADRRPGFPILPAWQFYPAYWAETVAKFAKLGARAWQIDRIRRRVRKDPGEKTYFDPALAEAHVDDDERLDLLSQTAAARQAVSHIRKVSGKAPSVAAEEPARAAG
jgi:hypothetical protein